VITDVCLGYFRHKELSEQEHEDVLNCFRKVLRQRYVSFNLNQKIIIKSILIYRKPDYMNAINMSYHASSASSSPKVFNQGRNQR
jgi:hypothetical protein